jgi:hypothetical protein
MILQRRTVVVEGPLAYRMRRFQAEYVASLVFSPHKDISVLGCFRIDDCTASEDTKRAKRLTRSGSSKLRPALANHTLAKNRQAGQTFGRFRRVRELFTNKFCKLFAN